MFDPKNQPFSTCYLTVPSLGTFFDGILLQAFELGLFLMISRPWVMCPRLTRILWQTNYKVVCYYNN